MTVFCWSWKNKAKIFLYSVWKAILNYYTGSFISTLVHPYSFKSDVYSLGLMPSLLSQWGIQDFEKGFHRHKWLKRRLQGGIHLYLIYTHSFKRELSHTPGNPSRSHCVSFQGMYVHILHQTVVVIPTDIPNTCFYQSRHLLCQDPTWFCQTCQNCSELCLSSCKMVGCLWTN